MKKLLIVITLLILTGCTPVSDDPINDIDLILNGDEEIILTIGDTYHELGAYLEGIDDSNITITGEVDTSRIGTYTVTYKYTYLDETYEKTRTVIVQDNHTTLETTCSLRGDSVIYLSIGDTYYEMGYDCTNPSDDFEMNIIGFVDTMASGTYYITYEYTVNGILYTLSRTVIVEEEQNQTVVCELNGDTQTVINQYDDYSDPLYTCSENVYVNITSDLDTSIPGIYYITYEYFDGEGTVILTREVTVLETTYEVTFYLLGEETITLNIDESFTDPGYIIDEGYDVFIDSDLDTSTAGTYTVTYSYINQSEETITLTRTIIVENENPDNFMLLGAEEITLEVGSSFIDPGYSVDNDYAITVDNPLDINTIGTYLITYSYTNSDGVYMELFRTIHVVNNIYYEDLDIYVNTLGGSNNQIYVTITGVDVTSYFDTYQIHLYQEDTFVESKTIQNGINYLTFQNLEEYHTYTVFVVGTLTNNDQTTESIIELKEEYIGALYQAPTVTFDQEEVTSSTYKIHYLVDDVDGSFRSFTVKILKGSQVVNYQTITSIGSDVEITELNDLTEYTIEITLTYFDGTNNQEEIILTKNFQTEASIDLFVLGYTPNMYQNELHYIDFYLDPLGDYMLNDIYINDVKVSSSWLSSYKRKVSLDTTQIGNQSFVVTGISVTKKSNQMTYIVPFNQLVSYKILDDLEVVHIPMLLDIHNDIETDNSIVNATKGNTLTLLFDNKDHLALSNIMFGVDHPDSMISNNNETIVLTYDSILNSTVIGLSEVTSFQYISNGLSFEQEVTSYNTEHYHLCDYRGVQSVSTPAEFISMIEGRFGCYELVNDIDMTGYIMNNYYTQEDIRISLYGNGFTVSNITVSSSNVNYASESSWGVFSTLNLAHIEDVTFDVNVSIGNSHTYAPNLYVGGLAGTIKDSYIENVTIIGTVHSNYLKGGAVGGMAGKIETSVITNSQTNVLITAQAYDETNPLIYTDYNLLGGLAGIVLDSSIELLQIQNKAYFTNNVSTYSMVGGVVSHLQNTSLIDTIVDSNQKLTIGTNSFITGGAVASAINSSLDRVYVLDNVTAKGTYLGGLVGYMTSSTIKNSFVAMDSIKQTGTSLHNGYILGGYTGTLYSNSIENNHYLDITAIQKGLDQINGSDTTLSGITSETLMTLESKAFIESLGYHSYHYDLDAYETETHYYPVFK